jgi:phage terminase large subunit
MISVNIPKSAYNQVYLPHLDNQARVQIFFGGSSSGKSVFVIGQRVVYRLLKGGHNFLICRQTKNSLRASVITEVTKVIEAWGLSALFTINKTDGTITCKNGYQAFFAGLDDVEKLKSITFRKGVLTDVIVEEATETERTTIKQLMKRQRGKVADGVKKSLTLLFNPILQSHWIYQDYFSGLAWADDQKEYISERLTILKTTYRDNAHLDPDDVYDLEHEDDKYYYNVYTLGNWGILGNVIFENWEVADLSNPASEHYLPDEQRTNHRNGLDFGFSSDPAALWVSHYDRMRKTIYIYDELYERGLTNNLLADEIKKRVQNHPVRCDSAEPKSIQELSNAGVSAYPAKKGKDSVNFGIQWMQQQRIVIDTHCINTRNEISTYHWKEDKDGNTMRVPVDKNNHLIDAGRYALEDDMETTWLW